MGISTHLRKISLCFLILGLLLLSSNIALGQASTSWKGTTSKDWNVASNWTSGVPTSASDVVVGDANFTGPNQPEIDILGDITIKSLTIGDGTKASSLLLSANSITITGNVVIGANATFENTGTVAYYRGNLTVKSGAIYKESAYSSNNGRGSGSKIWPISEFSGATAEINFAPTTSGIGNLVISGKVKLLSNLTITQTNAYKTNNPNQIVTTVKPRLTVNTSGSIDPGTFQVRFKSSTDNQLIPEFTVAENGTVYVKAATYAGNFAEENGTTAMFPTTLNALGVIQYTGTIDQSILPSRAYGVLRIGGTGTKTLLTPVGSVQTTIASNLYVDAATLDLVDRTLNRTAAGGTMNVANGATLRLSGANNFPINFATVDLGSSSTVEYYGAAQTVANVTKGYGNLHLIGSGTKTMPSITAPGSLVIAGNLKGAGSASFTAASNLDIAGNVDLSSTSSFNGGSFTHTVGGSWLNEADFTGGTSTVRLFGTGKQIKRTAALGASLKNEFYNLQVTGLGTSIVIPAAQSLTVRGNLETSGAGTLSQEYGGLIMVDGTSGAPRTISGSGITLNDLSINGFVTTGASFLVNGNFATSATGSFTATAGTVTMGSMNNGASYSITNAGTTQFFGLNIARTTEQNPITTTSSFNIFSDLSGNNLQASAGKIYFNGTSTLSGEHHLYDVEVTGTKLKMATASTMGVKGAFTAITAQFDAALQNTVVYNGAAQSITPVTYYTLQLSTGGIKSATGVINALGDIITEAGVTFAAGSFTHNLEGNWKNSGTLAASTGTINFKGAANTTVEGTTTFNIITINKTDATNFITLTNNITTTDVYLTTGYMKTGANSISVSGERYDNGWIEGTITKLKPGGFVAGISYLFNGPFVSINFGSITEAVTQVSVTSNPAVVNFPGVVPVNRLYRIQANGTYTQAMVRLQYEDSELNGNTEVSDEDGLKLSYSDSYPDVNWSVADKKLNSYTDNWVQDNGVTTSNPDGYTNITRYWALSDKPNRYVWKGTSNNAWEDKSNWYRLGVDGVTKEVPISPPTSSDIVELGTETHNFEPVIGSVVNIKGLVFKADHNIELTLSSTLYNPEVTAAPALIVKGNLSPTGTTAQAHTIVTGAQRLEVKSSVQLDNDQHKINITKASGDFVVAGNLNQGTASISLGAGNLHLKGDFNKDASSSFTTTTGTVTYEGGNAQTVADIDYYNLTVDKTNGVAQYTVFGNKTIRGGLTVNNGNLLLQSSTEALGVITVNGDIAIGSATTSGTLNATNTDISLIGNWNKLSGSFVPGTGTVSFIGGGAQSVSESTFNNLIFGSDPAAVVTATGNLTVDGNVTLQQGKLDLGTYTMSRSAFGGALTLAGSTTLELKGVNSFPSNFSSSTLDPTSTVIYSGTDAQNVEPVKYGILKFENGGTAAPKSLTGATEVVGDLTTVAGATLNGNGKTLTISGNFFNSGSYVGGSTYSEGTLVLAASSPSAQKKLQGAFEVHNMLLNSGADYLLSAGDLTIKGDFDNKGTIDGFNRRVTFEGNFINDAVLKSSGTAAFTGGRQQTIRLQAPIQQSYNNPLTGGPVPPTVEFNGSVSPVLNSTAAPQFGNVLINNSGGVTTSVNWSIGGVLTVKAGAKFHGGSYTHSIYTGISNEGIITSSGIIDFSPINQGAVGLLPTKPYYPLKFGESPLAFQSTGTLKIGGTEPVALLGVLPATFNNLTISNKNAGDAAQSIPAGVTGVALSTTLLPLYGYNGMGWNILGNLTIESGSIFNAGSFLVDPLTAGPKPVVYSISGNFTNQGALNASQATFTFKGADSKIEGSGTTNFGNLTTAASSKLTVNKNININSNLTHNGSAFSSGNYNINFVGAAASEISAPTGVVPLELSNFVVNKDTQALAVTIKTDLSKLLYMTVQKGILDLGSNTITVHPDLSETVDGVTTIIPVTTTVAAVDGATIKVGGTNTLPDADVTSLAATSTVEYYGGNQNVKQVQYGHINLTGTGSTKNFTSGLTQIAGNFTKASDLTDVVAPGTIEYNGTGTQAVAAINYNNLTISSSGSKVLASGTTGIAGAFTKLGTATADARTNSTTVNYNGATAQDVLPINYHHLTLSNSGTKTFSGTTGIAGNFTTAGTATADLTSTETIVDFNGSGTQNMAGVNYSSIFVSGGGGKTLTGNANVARDLRLTNGTINTGSNKFILDPTATLVESEGNYITGFVETQRTMTTSAENFGGLGITVTPEVSPGTVTVTRETGNPISVVVDGNTNQSVLRNFSFVTTGTNTGLNASVTLDYFTHELNSLGENTLQVYVSDNGTMWSTNGKSIPVPSSKRVNTTGISSLSRMTLGSSASPLPVELKYFNANKQGQNAVVTWETTSELYNKGFDVEVSGDGVNYRKLGFVNKGTATLVTGAKYTFTDTEHGKNGIRYYRLKQIDLSGEYSYYGPRALSFDGQQAVAMVAYPNPFSDKLRVSFSTENAGAADIKLYTTSGEKVYGETVAVVTGLNEGNLNADFKNLKPGLYLLIVQINGHKQSIKLVKE